MIFKTLLLFVFLVTLTTGVELDKRITIATLSILNSSHVYMKNESAVFEKINGIISDGADKLQFITDFDQTVTKQHENGVLTINSGGVFLQSKQLPIAFLKVIKDPLSKFEEIKFKTTVKKERKLQVWKELVETVQKRLKGLPFDRQEIEIITRKYGPSFRNRTNELFLKLKNLNIPIVIFSAGLSDVIKVQLNQENINYDNVHIIANRLKFNGTILDGFENHENSISAFNKHEHISHFVNSAALKSRKNKILMGDHTGDATIVREFEDEGTVLKIGFFYNQTGDSFEVYKKAFDIVLNDDQTMNVILDIIKLL